MISEKTAYILFIIKNLIYLEKALSIDYNVNVNSFVSIEFSDQNVLKENEIVELN